MPSPRTVSGADGLQPVAGREAEVPQPEVGQDLMGVQLLRLGIEQGLR